MARKNIQTNVKIHWPLNIHSREKNKLTKALATEGQRLFIGFHYKLFKISSIPVQRNKELKDQFQIKIQNIILQQYSMIQAANVTESLPDRSCMMFHVL